MRRLKITINYNGTRYLGWTLPPNTGLPAGKIGGLESAFVEAFEDCGFSVAGRALPVSSRTDSGVHALHNVCHGDVSHGSRRFPLASVPRAVNRRLRELGHPALAVADVAEVDARWTARHAAQSREYEYLFCTPVQTETEASGTEGRAPTFSRHCDTLPFALDTFWRTPRALDLAPMREACEALLGEHDFGSFRASGCQARSPVKTVLECELREVGAPFPFMASTRHGAPLRWARFRIRANSFVYRQVRLLVGALAEVGAGRMDVRRFRGVLNAGDIASWNPQCAPPQGLFLKQVFFNSG